MKALHLLISGRVQGVGYRDWLVAEANARHLSGWVRNTGRAQVEALLCGAAASVDEVVTACRTGPPFARVTDIAITHAEPIQAAPFRRLPSV